MREKIRKLLEVIPFQSVVIDHAMMALDHNAMLLLTTSSPAFIAATVVGLNATRGQPAEFTELMRGLVLAELQDLANNGHITQEQVDSLMEQIPNQWLTNLRMDVHHLINELATRMVSRHTLRTPRNNRRGE